MTEIQTKLLELYKYTISFLEKHNLRYTACAGTVLGAVRHKGFIPWDDDIDLFMPREDYNKLLSLKNELKKENKDVLSVNTDKGYYLPFAKIIDSKTTIWELETFPYIIGLYIDIFPVEFFNCSDKEITNTQIKSKNLFYNYQSSIMKTTLKNTFDAIKQRHFGCVLRIFKSLYHINSEKYLNKFLIFEGNISSDNNGIKAANLNTKIGRIYKRRWFEDVIEVPFEDTTTIVPREYDEYLTLAYGDWRTPPPLEVQQSSAHADCRYYINLKERLTLEQVKERIKNGEYSVL